MLTITDLELLAEDERRIAAEEDADRRRTAAIEAVEKSVRERKEAEARAEEERAKWRAIINSSLYLDSLPEARKDLLSKVVRRMAEKKPQNAELLRRVERQIRPPKNPLLEVVPDVPVCVVAPLTIEQIETADRADEALRRVEAKVAELYRHRVARHPNCGRTRTIHIRRDRGNGVEDMLIKPKCGRNDCPHCWRRRLAKSLRRAAVALLRSKTESNLPRTEALHFAEIDWLDWEPTDRAMRRKHGGELGRLRIRKSDNRVLIISELPFAGSCPIPADAACDLASQAIDHLHPARHSFRLLGSWGDAEGTEWRLIARLPGSLDLARVADRLLDAGHKSRAFKTTEARGLIWRCENEMDAIRLEVLITSPDKLRPTLANEKYRSNTGPNSGAPPPPDDLGGAGDGWTPFDDPPSP